MASHATAFRQDQYHDTYPPGIERHWWNTARNEIVHKAVLSLPTSRMLDVGCGPGLMVAYLRARGMDCWGCELASPEVRQAATEFVRTNTDASELNPEFRASIGIILLLDVLEHLPDPVSFLQALVNAYPALRGVVATVPARMELWTAWDDRYGHFLRFDRPGVAAMFDKSGFRLKAVRYFFQALYPALLMARHMNARPTSIRAPNCHWPHSVLAKWFVWESAIPGLGWVPGSSLLAVAVPKQKPADRS